MNDGNDALNVALEQLSSHTLRGGIENRRDIPIGKTQEFAARQHSDVAIGTPTASVTESHLYASNEDKLNLARSRKSLEDERQKLFMRIDDLNSQITEIVGLQRINLSRISQLEESKING